MALSTHFPHFSPQFYYKPHIRFVNTFQRVLGNFFVISVLQIENELVLNTNWGIQLSLTAKVAGKVETFFCPCSRGKICVLEVFVEELHAY